MRQTNRFPVLMYHSLRDGEFADSHPDKYAVSEEQFSANLRYLEDQGYTVDSCAGLTAKVQAGELLPDNYCVLTIDDGHVSGKRMAEMLSEKGHKATFFVTADYCRQRDDFLSATDMTGLLELGMDMGGHGVSHLSLRHMAEKRMRAEIVESMAWLEREAGRRPVAMSLPAGQGGNAVAEIAFDSGFQLLADSMDRLASVQSLPSVLHRFVVMHGYGKTELQRILSGSSSYVLSRRLRSLVLAAPKRILRSFDSQRPDAQSK